MCDNPKDATAERARDVVLRLFPRLTPTQITAEADLIDDLGIDELDTVELMMTIEEEFNLTIPPEVAQEVYTFGDLVSCITGDR